MLKLLLADDDTLVRSRIRNVLETEFTDIFEFYEADDGLSATRLVRKEQPSIVITDICMPGMNGLDMIAGLENIPDPTHFIVISGHDQFHYVKTALKLNVCDYMLKPLDENELIHTVQKTLNTIDCVCERQKAFLRTQQKLAMLKQLLSQSNSADACFLGNRPDYSLLLPYGHMTALAACGENTALVQTQPQPFGELFPDSPYPYDYYVFEYKPRLWVGVLGTDDPAGSQLLSFAKRFEQSFSRQDCGFTLGIGRTAESIDGLQESYRQALSCAYLRLYEQTGAVAHRSVGKSMEPAHSQIDFQSFFDQITQAGTSGPPGAALLFQDMFASAKQRRINPLDFTNAVKLFLFKLYDHYVSQGANPSFGGTFCTLMESFDVVCRTGTLDNLVSFCQYIVSELQATILYPSRFSLSPTVKRICDYVNRHCQETVSLQILSEHFGLSQNYISAIFRKETGIHFVDFVTAIKMEYAKRFMIQEPNIRVYELADRIACKDVKYFHRKFKAYFGATPNMVKRGQAPAGASGDIQSLARFVMYQNG